jgi:hypothetical protein
MVVVNRGFVPDNMVPANRLLLRLINGSAPDDKICFHLFVGLKIQISGEARPLYL